jgi:hypothetical protein
VTDSHKQPEIDDLGTIIDGRVRHPYLLVGVRDERDELEQPEEDEVRSPWGSSSHVHVPAVEEPRVRKLWEETQERCTTPAPRPSYNSREGRLQWCIRKNFLFWYFNRTGIVTLIKPILLPQHEFRGYHNKTMNVTTTAKGLIPQHTEDCYPMREKYCMEQSHRRSFV